MQCSNVATVTLNAATPDPPAAVADLYTTQMDTVLNVPAPGVLANDGTALKAELVHRTRNVTILCDPGLPPR